jgi:hypothetical protein
LAARREDVNLGVVLPFPRAHNSAVECHLHTVEVVGSNPAAPTIESITYDVAFRDIGSNWAARFFGQRFENPGAVVTNIHEAALSVREDEGGW